MLSFPIFGPSLHALKTLTIMGFRLRELTTCAHLFAASEIALLIVLSQVLPTVSSCSTTSSPFLLYPPFQQSPVDVLSITTFGFSSLRFETIYCVFSICPPRANCLDGIIQLEKKDLG